MNDLDGHPWMGINRDEWRLVGLLFVLALLSVAILVIGGL